MSVTSAARPRVVTVPIALPMAAMPAGAGIERGATAIVVVAHLHHRVPRRHPAGLPQPGQRGDDGNGCQDR